MSNFSQSILSILRKCESKKITEKMKGIDDLRDIYDIENARAEITQKSDEKGAEVTWNVMLNYCHQMLVTETERPASRSAKTCTTVQGELCQLISQTVSYATKPTSVHLKLSNLMTSIITILDKDQYQLCHSTYLKMLVDCVLSNRLYRIQMNLEYWQELLRICVRLYPNSQIGDKYTILKALQKIVHHGCLQSNLVHDIKKLLPFLSQVYLDVAKDHGFFAEPAYELTYSVIYQIGTECRQSLCEFSENFPTALIGIDGPETKFKVLLYFVVLHHPNGVSMNGEGSYCNDTIEWRRTMIAIRNAIFKEKKPVFLSPDLIVLAVEVFKQIMEDPTFRDEGTGENDIQLSQRAKRRRISMNFQSPIDLLNSEFELSSRWPIIQILSAMFEKYPRTLRENEYPGILKIVSDLFGESINNERVMNSLCQMGRILMNIEIKFFNDSLDFESNRQYWDKIWDILLKILGMSQNEIEGHRLLQSLIEFKGVQNVNAFVNLYFTNAIRWSSSSIRTLLVLVENVPISDETETNSRHDESDKKRLLRWILNGTSKDAVNLSTVNDLCDIVSGLTLKTFTRLNSNKQEPENQGNHDLEFKNLREVEKCALSQMFQTELFRSEDSKAETQESKNLLSSFSDENLDFVVQLLINSTDFSQNHLKDKSSAIHRLTVIAKFASNLLELHIEENDQRLGRLLSHFESSFKDLCEEIIAHDLLGRQNSHMIHVLRSLITFYEMKYHAITSEKILKLTQGGMLSKLFKILGEEFADESNEYQSLGIKFYENIFELWDAQKNLKSSKDRNRQKRDISNDSVIIMGVYRLLITFCTFDAGERMAAREMKVLQNLLKIEQYEQNEIGNLWKALALLKRLTTCRKGFLSRGIIEEIGEFIGELLKVWKKDSNGIIEILKILPNFVGQLSHYGGDVGDFLKILKDINEKLTRGSLGHSAHVRFLQSLDEIMRIDPSTIRRVLGVNVLVEYLNSPFYVVRMEALNVLHFYFSSINIPIEEKTILFKKIIEMFDEFFEVNEELAGSRLLDERATRCSSALCMLGCIIHASGVFQSGALNMLLILNGTKMKDTSMIQKILSAVLKNEKDRINLIEKNLYHLVNSWLVKNMPLEDFPWTLTQCESEVDFYKTHIGIILLSKLGSFELSCIEVICKSIPIRFETVIEENFPTLITWLLTAIANSENNKAKIYATSLYNRIKENAAEFSNVKTFGDLLDEKLDRILIDLIQRLHDEHHFNRMFELSIPFPEMLLPNFEEGIIQQALRFLEQITSEKQMIEFLVTEQPRVIQRVLSTLLRNIYDQNMLEYKLKAFHHYSYFCRKLTQEISHDFFDGMAAFTLRDICYSLVYLIKEDVHQLSEVSAKLLLQVLRDSLPSRSSEILRFFSFLVTSLIPIVQSGNIKTAIKILEYLVVDSTEHLRDSILKLNPFPNELVFYEMRAVYDSLRETDGSTSSLKSVIEHFLNSCHEKTFSCSLEGLMHLKSELANRREELGTMYKDLEKLRGFAEDCISSTLHRLIYRLIKLTESPDSKISLEAAECLGHLGPVDLTTMILHPEEGHVKEDGDFLIALTLIIISKFSDFQIESCMELRDASAEALYEIYSSWWGQKMIRMVNKNSEDPKYINQFLILRYTRPFIKKENPKFRKVSLDHEKFRKCIDKNNDLWFREKDGSYSKWIRRLTCKVLNCFVNFYSPALIQVCKLNTEFCEIILPRLIFLVIDTNNDSSGDVCSCINRFFGEFYRNTSTLEQTLATNALRKTENLSHESVRCMLNVVNFIRIQSGNNYQSQLNYLHIAKAAQYCSAYFTSVLYAELSSETLKEMLERTPDNISIIDHLCERKPEEGKALQDILRETFVKIGDPDSIHGCGLSHLKEQSSRIQHYIHFKQWDKALIAQDVELSSGFSFSGGMASSLQHSALDYLLSRFISTVKKDSENVDEYMYDTAWRLGDWSIFRRPENSQNMSRDDYDFYHYHALKSMFEKDLPGLCNAVENARIGAMKSLRNTSLECSQTIYPTLVKLQMLREVEELGKNPIENWTDLISAWRQQQNLETMNDFSYTEPILSQRIVMYQMKSQLGISEDVKHALVNTQLELSRIAEKQGHFHNAARALESLARQGNLSVELKNQLNFREALLSWTRKDQDIARYLLRNLINEQDLEPRLRAQGLRIFGTWVAEMKSETPQAIIDKYYERSIKIAEEIESQSQDDRNNINDTYMALAQFADAQYQQITDYMKGPLFKSLQETAKFAAEEASKLQERSTNKLINRAVTTTKKENINDVAEFEKIQRDQSNYLQLAVENYLITLINGEKHNFSIFRLISLWFKHPTHPELDRILDDLLGNVPTYKFIPLLPQVVAHISTERSDFILKINSLLKRCALEHPHHVLPYLLAMKNREESQQSESVVTKVSETSATIVKGAKVLINELSKTKIRTTITEMNFMAHSLIELAYHGLNNKKTSDQSIPANFKILKIRNFENSMIPTSTLEIKPNGNYDNLIGIAKYEAKFLRLAGMNGPKKLRCIGTDGKHRYQVLKVDPDIKNDAVMQQVFEIVDSLFRNSKETKRRKLNLRTYKVIQLTQGSGVLQWCENTMPISNILVGDNESRGLHEKYNPSDWSELVCREKISSVAMLPNAMRVKTYLKCCENFRPAFQYFFIEKFPSPETWFERRLAYVRSIATTSMVGYILGLGDRHLSNILIDQSTAEVVHIDFGVAFEQGKVLPIPETVPFRLTRDLEAAMGVSGVEGVLRRSCEETMTVLRDRREVISTLLDVLLYDPLFTWTVSPYKAHNMQSDGRLRFDTDNHLDVKEMNKKAKRALLRIEQKLLGTEEGVATSISGQVESLIQQARNPANLSLLFAGWRAFL